MASSQNISENQPKRRYVLADNLRPRPIHEIEKSESGFGAPTPAVRSCERVAAKAEEPELQDSIKAAMAAFGS